MNEIPTPERRPRNPCFSSGPCAKRPGFTLDALSGALSSHQVTTVFCDNEFVERIRDAHESVRTIDPATVQTQQQGEPRPKVAPSGRIVLLTSGTTGVPKGVPRVPRLNSGIGVGVTLIERTQLRVGSRIAVAVPMFHGLGLGMLMLTVTLGGTVLTHRRFDPETTLAQASLQRADAMSVVPIMLARLLDLPRTVRARNPVPSLRA